MHVEASTSKYHLVSLGLGLKAQGLCLSLATHCLGLGLGFAVPAFGLVPSDFVDVIEFYIILFGFKNYILVSLRQITF